MDAPQKPRALALLIAQTAFVSPTGGLNIIEIGNLATTVQIPNGLPPLVVVAVIVGGRPGQVYTAQVHVLSPAGEILARKRAHDVPFTTEIRRVNLLQPFLEITREQIVREPGLYTIRLVLNDEPIADTDMEIRHVPLPPGAFPPAGPPQS